MTTHIPPLNTPTETDDEGQGPHLGPDPDQGHVPDQDRDPDRTTLITDGEDEAVESHEEDAALHQGADTAHQAHHMTRPIQMIGITGGKAGREGDQERAGEDALQEEEETDAHRHRVDDVPLSPRLLLPGNSTPTFHQHR